MWRPSSPPVAGVLPLALLEEAGMFVSAPATGKAVRCCAHDRMTARRIGERCIVSALMLGSLYKG